MNFVHDIKDTNFSYESKCFSLLPGDEILVVNGKSLQGMKHADAINVFKSIKTGNVQILIGRRMAKVRKTADTIDTTMPAATTVAASDDTTLTTTQITIPVA